MSWLIEYFRSNPVIPIFLTLGLGFWLGNLKYKSFSLGPVTATLIVGVIIGQMDITIPEPVKSLFFLLFLFSIGYSVGPHFFRSLKGDGLKQILFAVIECCLCISVTLIICKLIGYNKGITLGVFAGSQAFSAVIGVGSDTLASLGLPPEETEKLTHMIPACYAVCYIFGTIGSAWIIANLGPRLLGGLEKVKKQTAELEAELDNGDLVPEPGSFIANRSVAFREYRAETEFFNEPRTVEEIEKYLKKQGIFHYVLRLRIRGEIYDPEPDLKVRKGDTLVITGRKQTVVNDSGWIGPEVIDDELMDFTADKLQVTVSKRATASGLSLAQLRKMPFMKGVFVQKILRNEVRIPIKKQIVLEPGDVVTLVGLPQDVSTAAPEIGYSDRESDTTDMVFLGLGIAVGCFFGGLSIHLGGVPVSLSTSGGTLIAGLVLGWLRNKHPTFGGIPSPVVWILDKMGLNMFIAVVGISAGPSFIMGLQEAGIQLFFIGILCTSIPLILAILVGDKIFRFAPAVTLGCVAGSRNAVAALGAIQDNLDSTLPAMSYTVTYAIGSLCFVLSGMIVALLA